MTTHLTFIIGKMAVRTGYLGYLTLTCKIPDIYYLMRIIHRFVNERGIATSTMHYQHEFLRKDTRMLHYSDVMMTSQNH